MLQNYEDITSLLSGDVPALVYNDNRDEAADLAALLAQLNSLYSLKESDARAVIDKVTSYLNPPAASGDFQISGEKANVKWSWQTARFTNAFPITLTAGQQVQAVVQTMAQGGLRGDTEVSGFMMTSTGRISTQIQIPFLDRKLSNIPVSANLMYGNAQLQAMIAQTLFSLPTTQWQVTINDLSNMTNSASPVYFSRRFMDRDSERVEAVRRAMLFSKFTHPYVLGPSAAVNNTTGVALSGGPEIPLPAGQQVTCRFDVGAANFDCRWILDDSSSTTGMEPILTAQILVGEAATPLMDTPISWRDFVASPTVAVTGMKQISGIAAGIAAASTPSPGGCWTHLFKQGTKLQVQFTSGDIGTITLRPAFSGVAIYAPSLIKDLLDQQAGNVQNGAAA